MIECCDILVANKTDLTPPEEVDLLNETMRALNPNATVLTAEYGRVELAKVLAAASSEYGAATVHEGEADLRRLIEKVREKEVQEKAPYHGHGQHSETAVKLKCHQEGASRESLASPRSATSADDLSTHTGLWISSVRCHSRTNALLWALRFRA